MPSVAVKLYSVYFKLLLKHKLQSQIQNQISKNSNLDSTSNFGVTSRSDESIAAANPSFASDGVATKDIHIDPLTALSIRIFLPDPSSKSNDNNRKVNANDIRRSSYSVGSDNGSNHSQEEKRPHRRSSLNGSTGDLLNNEAYQGYLPSGKGANKPKKLPVVLQFHGGLFVAGSNVSVANDLFCRRIAKLLDVIVVAVGYRLAPECRYPAAFEDGMKVLNWIGKQANLASLGDGGVKREGRKGEEGRRIVDTFGAASVEPWLAAHGDPSR